MLFINPESALDLVVKVQKKQLNEVLTQNFI